MRKPTHELYNEVIQLMPNVISVTGITSVGTSHTVTAVDTLWLIKDQRVTIDGDIYQVTAVTPNVSFVITHSTADPAGTTEIEIERPKFRHGTPMMTNRELTEDERREWQKFPLIWFRDRHTDNKDNDPFSSVDRISDIETHLLMPGDFEGWELADHDAAIQPMLNLAEAINEAFTNVACSGKLVNNEEVECEWTGNGVPNWGVYNNSKGEESQIFDVAVDGVVQKMKVPFLKQCEC